MFPKFVSKMVIFTYVFMLLLARIVVAAAGQRQLIRDSKNHLLESYDATVGPFSSNQPTVITFALGLDHIIKINERDETVTLKNWISQMWYDENLGWDPKNFAGLDKIDLQRRYIWHPDTYATNGIDPIEYTTDVLVQSLPTSSNKTPIGNASFTGFVRSMFPAIYKFPCNLKVQHFPFDQQNCTLSFGAMVHDSTEIRYFPKWKSADVSVYVPSEEWILVNFEMVEKLVWYNDCCIYPFSEINCHLVIRRNPLYYIVNIIIPTVVISVISTFGFFTPSSSTMERTEKVNLGVTTLLAMTFLLVVVSDYLPTASKYVPLISWFYLVNILLTALGTALTSLMIMIQQRGHLGKEVPESVRHIFFEYLAPMNQDDNAAVGSPILSQLVSSSIKSPKSHNGSYNFSDISALETCIEDGFSVVCKELKSIAAILRPMKESCEIMDRDSAIMKEWEFIAHVLDKIFLVFFMLTIIILTCTFFSYGYGYF